jgi:hypothetical protein
LKILNSRAGHLILFSVSDTRSSDTSTPVFDTVRYRSKAENFIFVGNTGAKLLLLRGIKSAHICQPHAFQTLRFLVANNGASFSK